MNALPALFRGLLIACFMGLFCAPVIGQQRPIGQFFVSGHMGGFAFSKSIKQKAYGSAPIFEYGGTAGFPVGSYSHLFIKISYLETSGPHIHEWSSFDWKTGKKTGSGIKTDGTSDFQYWRYNGGFQRSLPFPAEFYLLVNFGITIIHTEDYINRENRDAYNDKRDGWLGFFGGIGIEKRFTGIPLSVFSEVQFNTTNDNLVLYIGEFGGFSYDAGLRFYLPHIK